MRKIREVLRLYFAAALSIRAIVAVVPLVGDNLFNPRTVRLHQLHLLGRP